MSCSPEFVRYVADQLSEAGRITYKKLFGEYGLWCDGIFFGTVEQDQFYVKITPAGKKLLSNPEPASPHEGARMYLVEELEDREFLGRLVKETCAQLPKPKQRKRRRETI